MSDTTVAVNPSSLVQVNVNSGSNGNVAVSGNEGINVNLSDSVPIHLNVSAAPRQSLNLHGPVSGTRNYENLNNKPQINGVTLVGNKSTADLGIVNENTEAEWALRPLYVPKRGEIVVYSDTQRIKIGDGSVNCTTVGEKLIFNRT